jgi:1,4-dihydroxy-2-naphthoyl-CoA hydrolase
LTEQNPFCEVPAPEDMSDDPYTRSIADAGGHEKARELLAATAASSFDAHIGTEWIDLGADEARARIAVQDHHKMPMGLVHGGVLSTLAEGLCSVATFSAVLDDGMIIVGQSNDTTFLRPIREGHVNAVARPRHRGRTTWVWDVEISDDDERVCALVRMTIAVRPARRDG